MGRKTLRRLSHCRWLELPNEGMAASAIVAVANKQLRLVEEAFRSLSRCNSRQWPVYNKTDDRIKSHVFRCTLAYTGQASRPGLLPGLRTEGETATLTTDH